MIAGPRLVYLALMIFQYKFYDVSVRIKNAEIPDRQFRYSLLPSCFAQKILRLKDRRPVVKLLIEDWEFFHLEPGIVIQCRAVAGEGGGGSKCGV